MGRKKTISDREAITDTITSTGAEADEKLLRELAEEASKLTDEQLGLPTDLADYGWIGGAEDGKRRLTQRQVDEWIAADLGEHTALEQVLMAVIKAHSLEDTRRKDKPNRKNFDDYRLEQAMFHLVGKPRPRGPKGTSEQDLERIAEEYFRSLDGIEFKEEFLHNLVFGAVMSPDVTPNDVEGMIGDYTRQAVRDFRNNFQRLLFKMSWAESDEQVERQKKID